jgi:peptidyl-prolyl cis-trans isomerase SurA
MASGALGWTLMLCAPLLFVPMPVCAQATTTPIPVPTPTPAASAAPGQTKATTTAATAPPNQPHGEAASLGTVTYPPAGSLEPAVTPAPGVVVDQVVAVVNGDLVMESDVNEERRFEAFEPFSTPGSFSRDRAISRLVDRTLILQQAKLQPGDSVSMGEARKQLDSLRKDLPACKQYHCETDAGWQKFVKDQGFTIPELEARWQQRMEVLKFIEMRFRAGIDITPAQIKTYYETKMLPEYAKVGKKPPALAVISDRIQEVLLEEQVSNLLSDWLESLKAEGSVRMMRPGEVEP